MTQQVCGGCHSRQGEHRDQDQITASTGQAASQLPEVAGLKADQDTGAFYKQGTSAAQAQRRGAARGPLKRMGDRQDTMPGRESGPHHEGFCRLMVVTFVFLLIKGKVLASCPTKL